MVYCIVVLFCFFHAHSLSKFQTGWITVFAIYDRKGEFKYVDYGDFDVPWLHLDPLELPLGFVSVPVTVDDNGKIYDTKLAAGTYFL
jgi:hypothetical protein